MKHLLVSRVCRRANAALQLRQVAEILDVCENDICRSAVKGAELVLSATLGSNVRRQPSIDDHVFLPGVLIDFYSSDDEESVTEMQFMGEPTEL